ncbi:MAG: hypothetical protein A3G39_01925 [Deltaproteobacteria bacterium RIFCSPLOWO2_12_FULL_43_16]|nr:MAG: hypothetical protein A2Z89_07500 [Deltaproteobacteria bacterium GWA2_43_19]OGQ12662.1 MAG: hypothetical protein A3D30_02295 [Deltaproteobacteria bacterium RIFCSPHIGHO2_02_FULL_43_33]OGQ57290.1 MAG: hypothetical protein A3G39_01925 [Deltaproteobacteria bacterium RIFCSPLOWO2_12_FULL_43_16]HBR17772.1 hypothetical protein [Deltaproteobacteria bacterium]
MVGKGFLKDDLFLKSFRNNFLKLLFHPAPQEAPPVKAGRNGAVVPKGNDLEATAVKPWCGVHKNYFSQNQNL